MSNAPGKITSARLEQSWYNDAYINDALSAIFDDLTAEDVQIPPGSGGAFVEGGRVFIGELDEPQNRVNLSVAEGMTPQTGRDLMLVRVGVDWDGALLKTVGGLTHETVNGSLQWYSDMAGETIAAFGSGSPDLSYEEIDLSFVP